MSGLQHPLEPNGRSAHIRFTPPIGGTGNGGMAAYPSGAPGGTAGTQVPFKYYVSKQVGWVG